MKKSFIFLTLLSLAGVLFSGYLSWSKIFSGTCPLNEGCPLFLGYPACYTGFILFFSLFVLSLLKKTPIVKVISFLGIVFALYSTYVDLVFLSCPGGYCQYSLLLPTCIYGLFIYLAIFIISRKAE